MKNHKLTIAETFVGAGGSHSGFKLSGFKAVYAEDSDKDMIEAFKINNPDLPSCTIDGRQIQEVRVSEILKKAKIKKGELDVLFGGIVCCGFSLAGVRDPSDERNTFYKEQLRLVKGLMPKISIIENVPGMKNFLILKDNANKKIRERIKYIHQRLEDFKGIKAERRKRRTDLSFGEKKEYEEIKNGKKALEEFVRQNSIKVVNDIIQRYNKLGYEVYVKDLNASWYGAATSRVRTIIVAVRNDVRKIAGDFTYPKIKYWSEAGRKVEIIKFYKNGLQKEMFAEVLEKNKVVGKTLKELDLTKVNNPNNDKDNIPMNHKPMSVERFRLIPRGRNICDVMEEVPKHLKISKYYSRGCTMRLDPAKSAPTLVPGHSNFPVHPEEHRSITVREAAILTGFPKNYKFFGSHTKRCLQVGNAVPPPLAKAVGSQAKKLLRKYYSKI